MFLYGLLPLVAFAVLDSFAGIKSGCAAAVILALAEIFVMRRITGDWDPVSFAAAVLIIILGWVSIRMNNSVYFKFQPVVVAVLLALLISVVQFSSTPVVYRYLPLIEQALPAAVKPLLDDRNFLAVVNSLFNWVIWLILIHGALIAYAALRCSTLTWIIIRGAGFWILGAVMLLMQLAYLYVLSA